jgi:hypothetical protein
MFAGKAHAIQKEAEGACNPKGAMLGPKGGMLEPALPAWTKKY